MNLHTFRTIQGCPVYADVCPYIAIAVEDAYVGKRHATVNSIFRGHAATPILHKHGHLSQDQLYAAWIAYRDHGVYLFGFTSASPPNPANPPTMGTHILKGDGVVGRARENLAWWQQGFDVNDSDVLAVIRAGASHGWHLYQPYVAGSEFHHLNFREPPRRPRPGTPMWTRVWRIRATYPKT